MSRPAQPGEVLDVLTMVASTIQVELPEEVGLTAYVALLQTIPSHVLGMAAMEILRSHTYRTMPLPAEFLNTDAVREWHAVTRWLPNQLAHWRRQLQENSN